MYYKHILDYINVQNIFHNLVTSQDNRVKKIMSFIKTLKADNNTCTRPITIL